MNEIGDVRYSVALMIKDIMENSILDDRIAMTEAVIGMIMDHRKQEAEFCLALSDSRDAYDYAH